MSTPRRASRRPYCSPRCATPRRRFDRHSRLTSFSGRAVFNPADRHRRDQARQIGACGHVRWCWLYPSVAGAVARWTEIPQSGECRRTSTHAFRRERWVVVQEFEVLLRTRRCRSALHVTTLCFDCSSWVESPRAATRRLPPRRIGALVRACRVHPHRARALGVHHHDRPGVRLRADSAFVDGWAGRGTPDPRNDRAVDGVADRARADDHDGCRATRHGPVLAPHRADNPARQAEPGRDRCVRRDIPHTLLALREVNGAPDETVPGLAVVVAYALVFTSIVVLVAYVHHIGQALRVSALIELVGDGTRRLLDRVYPIAGTNPLQALSRALSCGRRHRAS